MACTGEALSQCSLCIESIRETEDARIFSYHYNCFDASSPHVWDSKKTGLGITSVPHVFSTVCVYKSSKLRDTVSLLLTINKNHIQRGTNSKYSVKALNITVSTYRYINAFV